MHFDAFEQGAALEEFTRGPFTTAHIFRWSAAIENLHRIHYDWRYATGHDGLDDVVINGSLKQHLLIDAITRWAGSDGFLSKLEVSFRSPNYCGETLTVFGCIKAKRDHGSCREIELDVGIRNEKGATGTAGTATLVFRRT